MALAATHIRLTLEKRDALQVNELDQYISGTMYPDSRYYTGIKRELTHTNDLLEKDILDLDDFRKGWAMHLLCDLAQKEAISELLPEYLAELRTMNDQWVIRTALKVLQDIEDAQSYDVQKYTNMMTWYGTPNGESEKQLQEFYALFVDLYSKDEVTIEDELNVWKKIGMDAIQLVEVLNMTSAMQQDAATMEKVRQLYQRTLERVNNGSLLRKCI